LDLARGRGGSERKDRDGESERDEEARRCCHLVDSRMATDVSVSIYQFARRGPTPGARRGAPPPRPASARFARAAG
jgi:hypothetical protein